MNVDVSETLQQESFRRILLSFNMRPSILYIKTDINFYLYAKLSIMRNRLIPIIALIIHNDLLPDFINCFEVKAVKVKKEIFEREDTLPLKSHKYLK